MTRITAPYNFVPLSRFVYFPEWGHQISHDIPFSDGLSGTLSCELVTDTPIYVRNGGNWTDADKGTEPYNAFFEVDGQPMIPGTSLKGMIRNVIEIATFGKLNRVNDKRYSLRDLHYKGYQSQMARTAAGGAFEALPKSGWLQYDEQSDQYLLTPCNHARVEHDLLNRFAGADVGFGRRQSLKTKYEQWEKAGRTLNVSFECSDYKPHPHSKVLSLGGGGRTGTLVFTGQPGGKKHMEFVFFDESTGSPTEVTRETMEEFRFVHTTDNGPTEALSYWDSSLRSGRRIPIFYLPASDGAVTALGLAQMFRLPYRHNISQMVGHTSPLHEEKSLDLAECLFGTVDSAQALKGRVSFSAATAHSVTPYVHGTVTTVLGAPKPTYYPNYVKQDETNGVVRGRDYKTYMDGNAEIRGWKRYPARPDRDVGRPEPPGKDQARVATSFKPLGVGTSFRFQVRFHNLRPFELGALFWALTWGGDGNLCHRLGMAKSCGMGQVRVRVQEEESRILECAEAGQGNRSAAALSRLFQDGMDEALAAASGNAGITWRGTEQLTHLVAMADKGHVPAGFGSAAEKLVHMTLDPDKKRNDFVDAKGRGRDDPRHALRPHAPFTGTPDRELFSDERLKAIQEQAKAGPGATLSGVPGRIEDPELIALAESPDYDANKEQLLTRLKKHVDDAGEVTSAIQALAQAVHDRLPDRNRKKNFRKALRKAVGINLA
jgi:CRISPR-associated protein (TIGR03986 family)